MVVYDHSQAAAATDSTMDAVALQLDNMINGISDLIEGSGDEGDDNTQEAADWALPAPAPGPVKQEEPEPRGKNDMVAGWQQHQPSPAPVASTSAVKIEEPKSASVASPRASQSGKSSSRPAAAPAAPAPAGSAKDIAVGPPQQASRPNPPGAIPPSQSRNDKPNVSLFERGKTREKREGVAAEAPDLSCRPYSTISAA